MFETLQRAPADAILGLIVEHRNDPRPEKIDLGVGVFRTAAGETPVLDVVKQAEQRLVDTQSTKAYIGTAGSPEFNAAMQQLTFAGVIDDDRIATLQAPGGSGALRVAAGLILRARANARVWVSDPTWANHIPLLGGAGLELKTYPYYDTARHVIRVDEMLDTLRKADKGDLVLVHACCHNPSGLDPSADDWQAIADVVVERELVPFVDMAYQGFAESIRADARPVQMLAERVPEMLVVNSCSKNFGLYRDRVGTLSFVTANREQRDIALSQASNVVRTIYSVPPDHGATVVATILNDPALQAAWRLEVAGMRARLREMRVLLNDALQARIPDRDFSHLVRATGMFCFLGITPEQVKRLKSDFGVYMVDSSRINIAGITAKNVNYLADSIAAVI